MKQFFKKLGYWFLNQLKEYGGRVALFTIFFVMFTLIISSIVADFIADRHKEQYHKYTNYEVYIETNQLRYDSLLLTLADAVDEYILKASNGASSLSGLVVAKQCLDYDIDICFVLAQGEQESHFGTQGIARKTNSVFNVFAFDGHEYNQINRNGKYAHPNDCVEPYIKLLKRDYLVNGKTEYDLLHKYVNKNGDRYASSTTYEQSLSDNMARIKSTTEIDAIYQLIKKQRLILGM